MSKLKFVEPHEYFRQLKAFQNNILAVKMPTARCTEHFNWHEFVAYRTKRDIKYLKLEHLKNIQVLALRLEAVRTQLGNLAIRITSGWRDPITNSRVGGATRSRHLTGEAADIVVDGLTPEAVQVKLNFTWLGGLGYGSTFTHLDIRPYRARFNY
jgi:uncharacterized protein YcbK (DUF882 family)